jgi:hypothetical protein
VLGAPSSSGAPADVDVAIDGRPVSQSAASASAAAIEPGLEPTIVASVDPTAVPASAITLDERGAVISAEAAAATVDPAVASAGH